MNSFKSTRKGIKRKKNDSPTFDEFEYQFQYEPKRKPVSQVLPSDKGWDQCKSGFDEDYIKEELISKSPWKTNDRKRAKHKPSSKSVKFIPLAVSDLHVEESEEEEYIEEEPADINWSSSEDSNNNISDVDLLDCDESPAPTQGQRPTSVPVAGNKSRKKHNKTGQWLRHIKTQAAGEEIDDAGDENSDGCRRNKEDTTVKTRPCVGELVVSQASTSKTDTNIDGYDSPTEPDLEVPSPSPSVGSEPSQNTGSAQISELSQSPTENLFSKDSMDSSTQITGTQWMKRFIQPIESPEKVERRDGVDLVGATGDSARKKKKFIKSGLAERMQKIINREKSSVAFWNHQLTDAKRLPQGSSTTLTVEVQSMEYVHGLCITRCTHLSQLQLTSSEEKADEQTTDGGTGVQQMYVLFSHGTSQNLKIAVGLQIQIYPPWQKLTLPNYKEPVILSTYFCRVFGSDGLSQLTEDREGSQDDMASTSTRALSPMKKPFQPLKLFENISKSLTHVTSSGSLLQSVVGTSDVKKVVSDSILDCIAESGGYSLSGMNFRARVQRLYCKRSNAAMAQGGRPLVSTRQQISTNRNLQWLMLVQDSHGVFCEIQLPTDAATRPRWKDMVRDGEGKVLAFSGVKVVHRTNRTRSPGLFSLIDSFTSLGDTDTDQQIPSQPESDSVENQSGRNTHIRGEQDVCYTLGFEAGQGLVEEDETQDKGQKSYKPSFICSLKEVTNIETAHQRVSFYATILHANPETNSELPGQTASDPTTSSHNTGWHVIISDTSLQRIQDCSRDNVEVDRVRDGGTGAEYVYLHVRSGCVVTGGGMPEIGRYGMLVLCRDLCVQQGCMLYADMYSAILKLDNNCLGCDRITGSHQPQDGDLMVKLSSVTMPSLKQLSNNSTQYSLVSVTGKIRGVDESTAFSWPVCATCGNEKLQENESGNQLMCNECNVPITNPIIKMHLEVFLESDTMDTNIAVKVKLLQSTIQSILPPLDDNDEGYDIQCIMGKTLPQAGCFISNITVNPSGDWIMELEEISVGD